MLAIAFAALMLASSTLLAQSAAPRFAGLDRNGDGRLSRMEAAAARDVARRFELFDLDGDARLSQSEYALAREDIARQAQLDSAITERVKAALAERGMAESAIAVQTYEGRVKLSGFVPAPDLVSRAGRVTAGVSGVRSVHNGIGVR